MAKSTKKNNGEIPKIVKENWTATFNLIGRAKVNDYTFKINEKAEKSDWIYNSLNLGIDCGEKYGTVYAEMMGGYANERENYLYVHGKKDDGTDDFENRITVDWSDREDEDVLSDIGDICFKTVGLETTTKTNKTFYKRFLSEYDAIAYIHEHLEDGMIVNVKGNLKYSTYNDRTQVRKTITSIVLSKVDDESKFKASFTQTILLDKDSASLKNIDKNKGSMYVDARVLDYVKEINGTEIKGQFPYNVQFEYVFPDLTNQEQVKKIMNKLFVVKKDVTQVTFEGLFIEGGATVQATLDDIPEDIRDLIDIGVYTEEEALARCSSGGNKVQRMILTKPYTKLVGEDKIPILQKFENQYTENDLVFDIPDNEAVSDDTDIDDDEVDSESDGDDTSWLDAL